MPLTETIAALRRARRLAVDATHGVDTIVDTAQGTLTVTEVAQVAQAAALASQAWSAYAATRHQLGMTGEAIEEAFDGADPGR